MEHDFKSYPELTNNQMNELYFQSPHKQITQDFHAKVTKVHDGDTITLKWSERDFEFPLRFINIAAPELSENGGIESRDWLKQIIEGQEVDIVIDPNNRVEKWGRLLGNVMFKGLDIGEEAIMMGYAKPYPPESSGRLPNIEEVFA